MYFYEGYSCPSCQQAFTETDDIVACPHCGLPHHRACWIKEGRCHLEHLHNTDEQWSRDKATATPPPANQYNTTENRGSARVCQRCGTQNAEFAEFCQHCGSALVDENVWYGEPQQSAPYSEYRPFRSPAQHTQTVNPSEEVDGVKMEDLAAIVGAKANYYLPRFRRISRNGSNTSWNWAAFFLGPLWLLYRKMYGLGILVMVLDLLQTIVADLGFRAIGLTGTEISTTELLARLQSAMSNSSDVYILFAVWLISMVSLIVSIVIGVYANRLYLNHCLKTVRRARSNTPDLTAGELTSFGGTSTAIAVIGYFAQYFISQILFMFI